MRRARCGWTVACAAWLALAASPVARAAGEGSFWDFLRRDRAEWQTFTGRTQAVARSVAGTVRLEALRFDFDPGAATQDAIGLRRDFGQAYDLAAGEWAGGASAAPACYVAGTAVRIQAKFTVDPPAVTSASIGAVSTDADGSLGDVAATIVRFQGGKSVPEYVTLPLQGRVAARVARTTTDAWRWTAENLNGSGSPAVEIGTSGPHTVYTVLAAPLAPWSAAAGNPRNAWTRALDVAINDAGGHGATNAAEALARIVRFLHTGHGLQYDIGGGRCKYATSNLGGTFDLTGYLDKSSPAYGTPGNVINCYDQAAAICVLGRLLGIPVTYSYLAPFGYIQATDLVGEGQCNNPFYPMTYGPKLAGPDDLWPLRASFGNHAFTSFGGRIYEACGGPHTGTETPEQYVAQSVDSSTPPEAAKAGKAAQIRPGEVRDLE